MIRRAFQELLYFARSAVQGLRESPFTSAIAVTTIAVTLLLLGAFALLVSNMEGLVDRFGNEVRLSVYLEPALDEPAQRALADRTAELPGVASVEWVSKEQALERFRAGVGAQSDLLDGLDENPLPASLEITLADSLRAQPALDEVAGAVAALEGVEEVAHGHAWVEGYARAVALLRVSGLAIGGVLALAAAMIVTNTIRLAVYARRDELEILMLVGAGRVFVAVPFLLEGLLQGLAGALVALAILFLLFLTAVPMLSGGLVFLLGHASPAFLGLDGCLAMLAAGAALGIVGSAFALLQGLRT